LGRLYNISRGDIDCKVIENLPDIVRDVHEVITQRLFRANLRDSTIIFVGPFEAINQFPDNYFIKLYRDKYTGSNAYLLTVFAGNTAVFQPPVGMSWDEYLFSLQGGNFLPLTNLLPWAQAKFINVINRGELE
jgi:hypothetical protein